MFLGAVLLAIVNFFKPYLGETLHPIALFSAMLLIGQIYRMRLQSPSGQTLSYVKSFFIALAAHVIIAIPLMIAIVLMGLMA